MTGDPASPSQDQANDDPRGEEPDTDRAGAPAPFAGGGLPAPLNRFVGRERDIARLAELARRVDVRLITLTGPGGVGKTRLALRVASAVAADFADGAVFTPLAGVRDPALAPAAIMVSLGIEGDEALPPREQLIRALRDRALLLVLDNFEQIVEAGVFVSELLSRCPGLTVLVTSRGPLRITGEHLAPVAPLGLPPRAADQFQANWQAIADSDAVQLFVERATAVFPDFRLTADNAAAVAAICARADGLPLAIELAAARSGLLAPDALLARLDQRLPVLEDGPRDQPARLQTMRAAIAWSHDLLTEPERAAFRELAVFVGGCTADAAAAVVTAPGDRERAALIGRLLDRAVLVPWAGAGEPRFAMLETIREFAAEQLTASGEENSARAAHAAWFVRFAERAEPELAGLEQGRWVARLEADMANIRQALDWMTAHGEIEGALRLAGAVSWLWCTAPYLEEARARFATLIAAPGAETAPAALAKVLRAAGDVEDWLGEVEAAHDLFSRSLAIYTALGDAWHMASLNRGLGSSAIDMGNAVEAERLLRESIVLARQSGHEWELAAATNLLGVLETNLLGQHAAALAHHEAAADSWRQLGDLGHVVSALTSAGWAAILAGEWGRAASAYSEGLEQAIDGQDEVAVAWAITGAGALLMQTGDARDGVTLYSTGIVARRHTGLPFRPSVQSALDRIARAARVKLGDTAYAAAWQAGTLLPLERAVERARTVFAEQTRETELPGARFGLTRRERDVLKLLAEGQSDREIADALFVSRATASKHVAAILAKLGADTRTRAVATAIRGGLV